MKPVLFRGYTAILGAPADWNDSMGPCEGLPIKSYDGLIASCWKPSPKERLFLILGFSVFLHVVGRTQPPVSLDVAEPNLDSRLHRLLKRVFG